MKKGEYTTAIILETRKLRKDGKYPIKLRVTFKGERHYYTCRNSKDVNAEGDGKTFAYTQTEFSEIRRQKPKKEYKEINGVLNNIENRATEIIKELSVFTFDKFEKRYYGIDEAENDIFSGLRNAIKQLKEAGRISTAVSYECALNSLKDFYDKPKLIYDKIDVSLLNKYEKWMQSKGNSDTTIGMYLRNVRTMFNIKELKGYSYPFGKGKYEIPTGISIKTALTHNEVGLIASYQVEENTNEHRFRDYWLFSFLCNGINMKDIALLKYSNIIDGEIIAFLRAKTKRERKGKPQLIEIALTKEVGRIIDKWGNKPATEESYIFPILEPGLTPQQEYERIQQTIKMTNKYIKGITQSIGIDRKVTTYTASHSFATVLKRSGASTEFISESLGHSNLTTTQNYLANFERKIKKEWGEKISNFKKDKD